MGSGSPERRVDTGTPTYYQTLNPRPRNNIAVHATSAARSPCAARASHVHPSRFYHYHLLALEQLLLRVRVVIALLLEKLVVHLFLLHSHRLLRGRGGLVRSRLHRHPSRNASMHTHASGMPCCICERACACSLADTTRHTPCHFYLRYLFTEARSSNTVRLSRYSSISSPARFFQCSCAVGDFAG